MIKLYINLYGNTRDERTFYIYKKRLPPVGSPFYLHFFQLYNSAGAEYNCEALYLAKGDHNSFIFRPTYPQEYRQYDGTPVRLRKDWMHGS